MTKGINMEYFTKNDEAMVRNAVSATFPGYCVSFMEDPDDSSVVFVRLYDVAENDIESFKQKLRKVLREDSGSTVADLIPSIVSSKNTRLYYSEYLRTEVHLDADDIKRLTSNKIDDFYVWIYTEPALSKWQNASISSLNTGTGVSDVGETSRFAA